MAERFGGPGGGLKRAAPLPSAIAPLSAPPPWSSWTPRRLSECVRGRRPPPFSAGFRAPSPPLAVRGPRGSPPPPGPRSAPLSPAQPLHDNPRLPKADGAQKRLSVERIYQKKTQLEHILLRPDTYIGSVETVTQVGAGPAGRCPQFPVYCGSFFLSANVGVR